MMTDRWTKGQTDLCTDRQVESNQCCITMHDIIFVCRKLRQRDNAKLHVQLASALTCMLFVFMVGINKTENRAGCATVGVFLHYFLLVSWMWMGAEALLLFQKLVIVFVNITTKYLIIISILCWGEVALVISLKKESST